ncbi:MAG: hypothetical protein V2B18_25190 [Pseudomonadota bacterium]
MPKDMESGPEPEQAQRQRAAEQLYESTAKALYQGTKRSQVIKELVKSGWPETEANLYVSQVEDAVKRYRESPEGRQSLARKYSGYMLKGGLATVFGIGATAATYAEAAPGGSYRLMWGAVLFGVIAFFWGLFGWVKYRH